jgi:hypothetical protein
MYTRITYDVPIGNDTIPVVFTAACYYKEITTGTPQIYPAIMDIVTWKDRVYTPKENDAISRVARSYAVKQLLLNKFEEENQLESKEYDI